MKHLKFNPARLILTLAVLVLVNLGVNAQASGGRSSNNGNLYATLEQHLLKSTYKYQKLNNQGWLVTHQNESILVGVQDDFMIVGIVVAKNGEYPTTAKAMKDLLILANELDFVKIAIDDDGDIFVRSEWKGRNMEKEFFFEMITGVTDAAKQTRRKLGSFDS